MTDDSSAVAVSGGTTTLELPGREVLAYATLPNNIDRIEQVVRLPPIFQYAISRYNQPTKVMITADGYDYLNRVLGVQLYQPEYVSDEHGKQQRNPIHRADYIYLRMVGIWYNDIGQMVSYQEDVEVNYKLVYHDGRINSRSAKIKIDSNGLPVVGPDGIPVVELSPEDELRALKALSQLRTFGMRYTQTVAKTRILKVATGVKQLPLQGPRDIAIRVVGYRDKLTPQDRVKKAEQTFDTMFGRGVDSNAAMRDAEIGDELNELLGNDEIDNFDADLVASYDSSGARSVTPVDSENDEPSVIEGLGLTDEEAPAAPRRRR
jgi:hypothetical protein